MISKSAEQEVMAVGAGIIKMFPFSVNEVLAKIIPMLLSISLISKPNLSMLRSLSFAIVHSTGTK